MNSLSEKEFDAYLFFNNGGIYSEDISRLKMVVKLKPIFFITSAFIFNKVEIFKNQNYIFLKIFFSIPLKILEPVIFGCNVLRFSWLLYWYKPKLVISCNGGYPAAKSCLAMVVAANFLGIPTALSIVSMPPSRNKIFHIFEYCLDVLVWHSCNVVIVNARAISQALVTKRGMPIDKSFIIHNGIDKLNSFGSVKVYDDLVGRDDFTLGLIARLDRGKGVLFLFDAFVLLLQKYPNLKLILVGEGDANNEIKLRILKFGLQDRVRILGYFEGDISTLLSRFDIYIFPSLWEGLPYSILEALRSSCVVVATKVGGIPEVISNNIDGVLIKPGSTEAIVKAVDILINNPIFCLELSRNAKIKFETYFTTEIMEERVNEVLKLLKIKVDV